MTLIYFIANNSAQAEALYECGVRNVCLDLSFFKKSKMHPMMEFNVMINAGKNKHFDAEQYYRTIREWRESFNFTVLQYDSKDIRLNTSYYHMGSDISGLIPIIHGDYRVGMNYYTPMLKTDYIALGNGKGKLEEDDEIKKLPNKFKYHGLGKFRWLGKTHSVDTPTWLSLLKNNKTYVMIGNQKVEVQYEDHNFHQAIRDNISYVNRCEIPVRPFGTKEKLKAPIALYYMPLCESLGIFEKNFN